MYSAQSSRSPMPHYRASAATTSASRTSCAAGWQRCECSAKPSRSARAMLRQALENLIDNAATCGMGAPVDVVVRFSVARRVPGIEVLVADRGPGLGRAPDRRLAGGVGLQLVRQFAQEAGGRLWSRDREGGGALFGLWLPAGRLTIAGA